MARLEIRPLGADTLDEAGHLLAERHRAHRRRVPALDASHEQPAVARAAIEALLARDGAAGVVAVRDGSVAGYLVGSTRDPISWGPNAWVEAAGHAATDAEVVRELYAAVAAPWVDAGRTGHSVIVPATDPVLVDAWFSLGFGRQHVHAIRATPGAPPAPPPASAGSSVAEVTVRRAAAPDLPAIATLDLVLPAHNARGPVFSKAPVPTYEAALEELEADDVLHDPTYAIFVAEHRGRVVGEAAGCAIEASSEHAGIARPPGAGFLAYAAVLPEARGIGVGRALGEAVLDWARAAGHATIVADWRVTNIEANRAWNALGFQPVFHRLHRAIG